MLVISVGISVVSVVMSVLSLKPVETVLLVKSVVSSNFMSCDRDRSCAYDICNICGIFHLYDVSSVSDLCDVCVVYEDCLNII